MTPDAATGHGPVATYLAAARGFVDLVALLRHRDLSGPGLGEWELRSLVGHASRSIVTVHEYLDRPAAAVEVETAADYVVWAGRVAASGALDPADIVARGVAAGAALGDDPLSSVQRLVDAVTEQLGAVSGDPVITTIAGGMRLSDYLPTRVFELVVHGLDIVRATGVGWAPHPDALAVAVGVAVEAAVARGDGATLLLALTGREGTLASVV
jgi:hypothetical protein